MKLLSLLRALQPDERKEFEKFLASPFFKAGEQQQMFFKFLCKHHSGFDLGKAELEAAYRRCFGKDSYADNKLYNLMSSMAKQVEDFMAIKFVLNDREGHLRDTLLVRALGQRKAGSYYRTEAQRLADAVEKQAVKNLDDYLLLEQLYSNAYFNP
ncbi:MAG: hypothetical protein IT258_05745, partial [Saprospiraceae bacterium]|nr:hypothetical protein [Saprospiraceae bacterium]